MPELTLIAYLFLLQSPYWVEDDPNQARIVIIAIAVLIAFVLVFRLIRRGGKSPVGSGGTYASAKSYNVFTLRRAAAPYGLDGEQVKLLDYVFRNDNVTDPVRIMGDSAALDRHFRRAYRNIDSDTRDEARTQQNLSKLFVLRNTIEAAPIEDESSQPVENSQALIRYGKDNYNVRLYTSQGRNIITEPPKSALGTSLRVSSGTNVNLTYLSRSNNSYSLPCSYAGVVQTEHGPGFKMNRSGRAKTLTKRQTRRRQIDLRCEFFLVSLVESGKGRNKTSKLIVSPKRYPGTIRDISAGGCSIRTAVPVQAGSRLKINCNLGNGDIATVLGQVIRSNRSATVTVLHVKFLKVPMSAFNSINTLVFGYSD
jgi:hypothetical protein